MDALRENQVFVGFVAEGSSDPELPLSHESSAHGAAGATDKAIEPRARVGPLVWKIFNQMWHALFRAELIRHIGPEEQAEVIRNCEHELNMRSHHWRI